MGSSGPVSPLTENLITLAAIGIMFISYSAGVYLRYRQMPDLREVDRGSLLVMYGGGFLVVVMAFWTGVSCLSESVEENPISAIVGPAAGTLTAPGVPHRAPQPPGIRANPL
jgi:hypothetical protein